MKTHLVFRALIAFSLAIETYAQVPLPSPTVIAGTPCKPDDPSSYANLFDGNISTYYSGNNGGSDTFLVFDFGTPKIISGFRMVQRNDGALVSTSNLLFSNTTDFSSPIAVYSLTHTASPWAENTFSFTPITARYVYWDVTGLVNGGLLAEGASEMAFYGPPGWKQKNTVTASVTATNYDLTLSGTTAYVAYENNGNIYVTSKDFGLAGWKTPQLVAAGTQPSITTLSGVPYVAYVVGNNVNVASYNGSGWSSTDLGAVAGTFRVMLRTDGTGTMFLMGESAGYGSFDLATNNGSGWSAFTNLITGAYADHQGNYYHQVVLATAPGGAGYKMAFEADNWGGQASWSAKWLTTSGFSPDTSSTEWGWNSGGTLGAGGLALTSTGAVFGYSVNGVGYVNVYNGTAWAGAISPGNASTVSVSALNGTFAVFSSDTGTLRQFDGTTSADIGYALAPVAGTAPLLVAASDGSQHFLFLDTANSNALAYMSTLTAEKVTPTITWTAPAAITYGTALSATQLNATSGGIAGAFVYTPATGTVLNAGAGQTLSVSFTPADTTSYNSASGSTTLTVNKATPTITWAAPDAITYGTVLSSTQLNATAGGVAGTFTYTPAAGTVLNAGTGQTLSVAFTPTATTNYNSASGSTTLTVNKVTPTITWAAPAAITYGTALSATQLNATSGGLAGTFTYTLAAGTVLNVGAGQTLGFSFTPTDTTNYNGATGTAAISVNKAPLTVTAANQFRLVGAANPTLTISYSGFVNSDTVAAITPPTASTGAAADSPVGTYPITLTGGTAANYTLTLVNGTLTVLPPDYKGHYFGTFASGGGHWALYVRPDNTAVYIAYLPDRHSAIVVHLTIGADGTFTVNGTEIIPAVGSVGSLGLGSPEDPVRKVAVDGGFTLTGQIGISGAVTGQLTGLGATFTGAIDAATGPAQSSAGFYTSAALGTASGSTYAIVGASGQALVVTTSPTLVDGAAGTVSASGQMTATTSSNAQLAVTINPTTQTVSVSLTPSGASTPIIYYGLNDTVTPTGYLANLSVRAAMDAGQTLIVGFVVDGGAKPMLVRACGPALNRYGLTGVVDPFLSLYKGGTLVTQNDNWDAALASTFATLGAFAFDAASKDAALQQSINGPHSAQATATGPGALLVETYDAGPNDSRKLVNLSTRFQVGTGDNILIAGFVLSGTGTKQVLIRAVGPTLASYGVTGTLADPVLTVYNSGTAIASNDNWSATLTPTFDAVGAFHLLAASKDAALVVTLQAGKAYTNQVSGVGGTTGEALIEIYLIP
jgi:hypothetical protein